MKARRCPAWFSLVALGFASLACGDGGEEREFGPTIPEAPADPLAGGDVYGCPVFLEELCKGTTLQRCDVYDTGRETFVDEPDPLLRRVFLYDRWYDLYNSPAGLTAERVFSGAVAGSTAEAEWGSPDNFKGWAGAGDAAIWTGAALVSDIFRYTQTGTQADYTRVEDKVRTLLRNFEVTGIPGYLARYHFLFLPADSPKSDQIIARYGDSESLSNRDNPIEDPGTAGLQVEYETGLPDGAGGYVTGTPMWNGHPSIDQYTGPMTAFPLVFNLLRDEDLKTRIIHHMTCYLKRLRRMEIIRLDRNPDVRTELTEYFGGVNPDFDPDDPDLLSLDKLVVYYHAGFNQKNKDAFDRSCPDSIALEPNRVIDATDDDFMLDMIELALDLDTDSGSEPRDNQIDHFYIANVRGGDASHLMHLAAMAYMFTGDEQYRTFLYDELIGNLDAVGVARTMMAFRLPDWCFKFYGDHITYGTHWQFITMLGASELKDEMIRVMEEEAWQKALFNHKSAKFDVMYASCVPESVASAGSETIQEAIAQLRDFGGNDGVQDAPRRTYTLDRQTVIDALPGDATRCPTEQERAVCEEGGDLFGIPLEQEVISFECDGRPGECLMGDGMCTDAIAKDGLPASLRRYADFMWQRSPFDIGESVTVEGQRQSPGRDLTEPYWMARYYGFIPEGAGQVLAWRDVGTCQ